MERWKVNMDNKNRRYILSRLRPAGLEAAALRDPVSLRPQDRVLPEGRLGADLCLRRSDGDRLERPER